MRGAEARRAQEQVGKTGFTGGYYLVNDRAIQAIPFSNETHAGYTAREPGKSSRD